MLRFSALFKVVGQSSVHPPAGSDGVGSNRVLVVLPEGEARRAIQVALAGCGCRVDATGDLAAARDVLAGDASVDAVLCAAGSIDQLGPLPDGAMLVALAERGDAGAAIAAFDRGAVDALLAPVDEGDIGILLRRLRRLRRTRPGGRRPRPRFEPGSTYAGMVGESAGMRDVFRTIERLAAHKANVLITGESGTGKELVARAIHARSPRASGRFVAINCGAIPATLLESELFGYVRGAFTDAVRDKPGLFEQADGGTLFLDEIGELSPPLQVKLLRVLQEEEVRRVGATSSINIDVRVIAATLRDLGRAIETGEFREDLFYRLNVLPIALPPLRDRPEDIPALVEHFLTRYADKHAAAGTCASHVSAEAMKLLCAYAWPGNIRELENTIERALVLCDGEVIEPAMLETKIKRPARGPQSAAPRGLTEDELSIKKTTRRLEQELIRRALESTNGNRTNAAKLLEISHRALLYKIKEYGL